jgi:SnoaL-like domain
MSLERERATALVENYGRTWERWDIAGFVELFSDAVLYVDHPTKNTVFGSKALTSYLTRERAEQGAVRVRMGKPIVEGDHVVGEFWVARTNGVGEVTLA